MSISRLHRKMHDRPEAGQTIIVYFENGSSKHCTATMIWSDDFSGIMIYHKRKSIDESKAIGWMPTTDARRRATDYGKEK